MFSTLKLLALFMTFNEVHNQRIAIETKNSFYDMFPLNVPSLEFTVKADSSVYIAFTNTPFVTAPYYKILLGGNSNKQSSIMKDSSKDQVTYPGKMLSGQYQMYNILLNNTEGSISVSKGVGERFLYFLDPSYVRMTYFGITSIYTASWNFDFNMFDCDCCFKYNY